jgi:hypothetical protein
MPDENLDEQRITRRKWINTNVWLLAPTLRGWPFMCAKEASSKELRALSLASRIVKDGNSIVTLQDSLFDGQESFNCSASQCLVGDGLASCGMAGRFLPKDERFDTLPCFSKTFFELQIWSSLMVGLSTPFGMPLQQPHTKNSYKVSGVA